MNMDIDIDALQADLHDAVDRTIDQYRTAAKEQAANGHAPKPTADRPVIRKGGDVSPWTYTWWAGGGEEEYRARLGIRSHHSRPDAPRNPRPGRKRSLGPRRPQAHDRILAIRITHLPHLLSVDRVR